MALYSITGNSGAGKSSVCDELTRRGWQAYDADRDICRWYERASGQLVAYHRDAATRPTDWHERHEFLMSAERVAELAALARDQLVFLCGVAPNDLDLSRYFEQVIFLLIDRQTMHARVTSRTNNAFGHSADQLAAMDTWYAPTVAKYSEVTAVVVDAEQGLNEVVDDILAAVTA